MIIGICEDQAELRADLRQKIEKQNLNFPYQVYEYASGEEMLNSEIEFDLVFLDIELEEGINGLEVAQKLQQRLPDIMLVFVSGYTRYVPSAFHLKAFQFLLKPVDDGVFAEEFLRCVKHYRVEHDLFRIVTDGEKIDVHMKEIVYIESDGRKILVHLRNGKCYEMYGKIGEQEEKLAVHHFIRIHKSYLVNCKYIKKMSDEMVWLSQSGKDEVLPVSRRCKAAAREKYHQFFLGE